MLDKLKQASYNAASQLLETAKIKKGDIMVVGCSSSEIGGQKIGTDSSLEIARSVFDGIYLAVQEWGVYLAAQCCEHLNRAIVIEQEAAAYYGLEQVNVVPQPKAGGSFATTAYERFEHPVAVESVKAHCGLDIGGTLIGMHLKEVAVPVRLSVSKIGEAHLLCARTRPKFIGGSRANYDPDLL